MKQATHSQLLTAEHSQAAFQLLKQLRPHLESLDAFEMQLDEQHNQNYQLAGTFVDDTLVAVAGFRIAKNFAWGQFLYIDDLVCDAAFRGQGYAKQLFQFLVALAKDQQCTQLHLDSGIQRFDAHRFYLSQGMDISSHHFRIHLD